MNKQNLLVLLSDEHNRKVLGCMGHPMVRTPNLDGLAAQGTLYTNAYATSPICVPARASIATGRYLFQMGHWDNADPYDGTIPSWHHVLRDAAHEVAAIGKLHFSGPDDNHGFTDVRLPMHVPSGTGDLLGLLRDAPRERSAAWKLAALAGPGESDYTRYDRAIAREAGAWLQREAVRLDRPWTLFVSFVAPHFPLIAPPEFFEPYAGSDIPLPKLYARDARPHHPALDFYRDTFTYDRYFGDEAAVRRAIAAYYGLCSFLDHNVGTVLSALEQAGLRDSTTVVYTSDHGDNLGARGLWGKSTMYEEAVGVPLIGAGTAFEAGRTTHALTSHIDIFPFVLDHFGIARPEITRELPGRSFAGAGFERWAAERAVFAEYHATGSRAAFFMVRHGPHKLVHYVDAPPQLFDLERDPEELCDRSGDSQYAATLAALTSMLYDACDPAQVDARARARQAELIARAGGLQAILAKQDYGFSPVPEEVLRST